MLSINSKDREGPEGPDAQASKIQACPSDNVAAAGGHARPIRIMVVGPLPPPIGGATLAVQKLIRALERRSDTILSVINTRKGSAGGLRDVLEAARVIWTLWKHGRDVDVITFHANKRGRLYLGPFVYLVARLLRRPLVVRAFGGTFDEQFGRMTAWKRWVLKGTYFRSELCLFETKRMVKKLARYAKRAEWFSNSVAPSGQSQLEARKKSCRKLVFLSRVTRSKGIDTLVEASRDFPDGVSVDVFGPIEDEKAKLLLDRCDNRKVAYKGIATPEDVGALLWQYDALALPTRWPGEGYPAVILEAYAQGLPVIATRWQCIPEIVDETTGILVPPSNPKALAEAIHRMCSSDKLYQRLQEGVRKRAPFFYEDYWVERFVEWCREVAGLP